MNIRKFSYPVRTKQAERIHFNDPRPPGQLVNKSGVCESMSLGKRSAGEEPAIAGVGVLGVSGCFLCAVK